MPLFLNPPPRQLRITRRNFIPPERPTLQVDPTVAGIAEPGAERLLALFPGMQQTRKIDVPAEVSLSPLEPEGGSFRLEVAEEGIELGASGREGFLYGAEVIRQLAADGEVVGVVIEDAPAFATREIRLPLPADGLAPEYWPLLLENLAWCRFNVLSLAGGDETSLSRPRRLAAAFGIEIGVQAAPPARAPALVTAGTSALRPAALIALQEEALRALAAGEESFSVALAPLDDETFLDPLWFGLAFAGACAWNPRKADLKTLRRSFAAQFFGAEAAEAQTALDALEDALTAEASTLAGETAPWEALFREDPFSSQLLRRLLRAPERAREAQAHVQRALLALEAAGDGVSRNEAALKALAWPLRRLDLHAEHLLALQRIRESYADAFLSTGNPRAASKRILSAAEDLGALANRVAAHETALREIASHERAGAPSETALARTSGRVQLLREKAGELRELRDRYVQTGKLPTPEAIGLDRTLDPLGRVLLPGRLPRRHSPAWWPEGGAARVRIETKAQSSSVPWEIPIDFRELAGEESAFHVGGARLVRFDDATDTVGADVRFQLTRSGLLFAPEDGARAYYLYLDPKGTPAADRRTTNDQRPTPEGARVRQPQSGIIVESPWLLLRVEREAGTIDRWQARDPDRERVEELVEEEDVRNRLCVLPGIAGGQPPRLRVTEHGAVLTRVQAEHADGRICQYDLYTNGDSTWCEFATNAPVPAIEQTLRPEPWGSAELRVPTGTPGASLDGAEVTASWTARARSDGLTFALLCPEGPARHRLSPSRHDVTGAPLLSRLLLWGSWAGAPPPEAALEALAQSLQHPPTVNFGPIEERRAREF
jgi:hypothetical protein